MSERYITAQDLYKIVTLSDPCFSPDGQNLAYVRTEIDRSTNDYKSSIWLALASTVPAEIGGHPRQFTNGGKRDSTPRWSPDGRWLAFVSDRGDDEARPQLYLIPTDGGEALCLVEMENGSGEPVWSPDGTQIAFTSRANAEELAREDEEDPDPAPDPDEVKRQAEERQKAEEAKADPRVITRFGYRADTSYFDDRTAHLYLVEVDAETGRAVGKPRRLTQDARNYASPRWLPDGSALLAEVSRQPGTDDLFYYPDVVRVPLSGGEPEILTSPETADHNPWPSPDGQWIAYNSLPVDQMVTANGEIVCVAADGQEQEPKVLTSELDAHAREFRWLPDGQGLCCLVSEGGRVELRRVPAEGGPVEMLVSGDREMLDYDLSPDGQRVAFVASTDRAPSDLYLATLDGSDERRLTEVNAGWLADKALGEVKDIWFQSADGTEVQGWVVKPPDFDPAGQYPLILAIHGGPHAMWSRHTLSMWHEWQMQAAAGYVVLACNPRGSDGYGRDYRAALVNRWGEADLPDLQAGIEAVLEQGYVDPERLVITGGSYGGFMTAWVIGHDDRFKAAVAQRGVYDLLSFSGTTDIPRFAEWEFLTTPWEDPQHLWRYSPVAHVENIHTPLLLIHSENDYRAPIPSAEGLFVALRRLGREVEMVRYPREGHELSRSGEPKHRIDRLERIVEWFDRHIQT